MKRIRRLLAATTILALLFGMPGIAAAAFPDVSGTRFEDSANYLQGLGVVVGDPDGNYYPLREITRGEATKIIINIMGRGDQVAALMDTLAFPDTVGHWANGYIALAKNLEVVNGYPDGTFKPNANVTYAEMAKMLVVAAGLTLDPALTWPQNAISAAEARGLFTGIPSYLASIPAIRGDCGMMTAHLVRNVANPLTGKTLAQSVFGAVASLDLSPQTPSTPAGAAVQFHAVPKDAAGDPVNGLPVAFTVSNPANATVTQTGLFNSALPGTYTVTASTAGISQSVTVSVFGASTRLRATPSASQVGATGASVVTITVEVVDAIGNRVTNNNSAVVTMAYAPDGSNGAVVLGDTTKTVAAGAAVFEVTSTTNGDRADTLEFTSPLLTKASTTISTVDQVPTSIVVTADPAMVSNNAATKTQVTATILDQSGAPMTGGSVTLSFAISGPGRFAGGSVEPFSAFTGSGSSTQDVFSIQGEAGTIVVTVSAEGLTPGQVSIVSYTAGTAVGLNVEILDGTVTAAETGPEADVAKVRVSLVDVSGRPSTRLTDTELELALVDGDSLASVGLVLTGDTTIAAGESYTETLVIAAADGGSGKAGVHEIEVDVVGGALAEDYFEVRVVPGLPEDMKILPGDAVKLPVANTTAVVTVQLVDAAGNNVATPGIDVSVGWEDVGAANQGLPIINGTLNPPQDPASTYAVKSATDSGGLARFTFAPHGYVGDDYRLSFETEDLAADSGVFTIVNQVAEDITLKFTTLGGETISQLKADWSEVGVLMATVKDGSGNAIGGWDVEISFPNGGENVSNISAELGTVIQPYAGGTIVLRTHNNPADPSHGQISLLFQGAKSGTFVTTAEALGLASPETASRSFRINKGGVVAGVKVTTPSGGAANSLTMTANTPVALKLVPTDHGGNQITSPVDVAVLVDHVAGLYSTNGDGEFRLQADGTAIPDGEDVLIVRGTDGKTIHYVQPDTESGVAIGVDDNDDAYVGYVIELAASEPATPAGYVLTFEVKDASGNPVPNVAVELEQSVGGLSATSGTTNASGLVSVTWTGGGGGQITATVINALLGGGINRAETLEPWPLP